MFCAPSLHGESFGVVLIEAMSAGTAVVASGIDGYRNVATDGEDALLVAARRPRRRSPGRSHEVLLDDDLAGVSCAPPAPAGPRDFAMTHARRRVRPHLPRADRRARRRGPPGALVAPVPVALTAADPIGPLAVAGGSRSSRPALVHSIAMTIALIVIAVVVVLLIIWLIAAYNGLIRRRNQIENAWSQIDVQLKRRLDLIPNLVETVKGYAAHERETLDAVIKARNSAIAAPDTPRAQAAAEQPS